jgi:hypothetical protein
MGVVRTSLVTVSPGSRDVGTFDFDTFTAATALAGLAGFLSLLAPFLRSLTGCLVALGVAAWVVGRGGRPLVRGRGLRIYVSVAALAGGVLAFLLVSAAGAVASGAILGVTLLPLWWAERRASATAAAGGT